MISRRIALIGMSAGLAVPSRYAFSQTNSPPKPEDVAKTAKEKDQYVRMLVAMDALRQLLILRLLQTKVASENPTADRQKYFAIRAPFDSPDFVAKLQTTILSPEGIKLVIAAGASLKGTVANIENTLEKGGVSPKGEIGIELVDSFYKFVQMKAVADNVAVTPKESWYCSIYPFSRFCAAA